MVRAPIDDGFDYRDPACPQRQVLDLIADRWSVLVLLLLARGTTRYNRLLRDIGGISPKMLTQTLRGLERDGLVTRRVYPVVPPKVEYALTPLGESLREATSLVLAGARRGCRRWRRRGIATRHMPARMRTRVGTRPRSAPGRETAEPVPTRLDEAVRWHGRAVRP